MDIKTDTSTRIYEFPLSSRLRYFLRCESLAHNLSTRIDSMDSPESCIETLRLLIELEELTKNIDLRSEIMQHLRWQIEELKKLDRIPQVNQEDLHQIIRRKEKLLLDMENFSSLPFTRQNNHFLNSIKRRINIPGGVCSFDLPILSGWFTLPREQRLNDIRKWYEPFSNLCEGITDCLELSRSGEEFVERTTKAGYYSQEFENPGKKYQMLRIALNGLDGVYPEVSAGKPRFTIHFFILDNLAKRPQQVKDTISFKIAFCRF